MLEEAKLKPTEESATDGVGTNGVEAMLNRRQKNKDMWEERLEKILPLRREYLSYGEIAERLGIDKNVVRLALSASSLNRIGRADLIPEMREIGGFITRGRAEKRRGVFYPPKTIRCEVTGIEYVKCSSGVIRIPCGLANAVEKCYDLGMSIAWVNEKFGFRIPVIKSNYSRYAFYKYGTDTAFRSEVDALVDSGASKEDIAEKYGFTPYRAQQLCAKRDADKIIKERAMRYKIRTASSGIKEDARSTPKNYCSKCGRTVSRANGMYYAISDIWKCRSCMYDGNPDEGLSIDKAVEVVSISRNAERGVR